MFHRSGLGTWLLFIVVCGSVPLRAQSPVGSLDGVLADQTGAVVPGASIAVTNKTTGAERQVTTSPQGSFAVGSLPAGEYFVKASAEGFRTLVENATVQVGQTTTLDLMLQIGSATEVISVQAEAAQLEYDSHTLSGVITRDRIESLPLNGRSFLQLAMLEPGVTVSANNVGQYNRLFDVNILGAGSANGSVRITVDGASIADSVTGGTQQNFSQEVVQEFQLTSTNMDLSTGIGAGGSVNIVTRTGGNDFHGSAFFFFRDHNMSAYPYLAHDPSEPASPFFARRQAGYELGGRILRDRLFFFSSLEHTNQLGVYSAFSSDPLFQKFGANAAGPFHENELTERLDWRISAKHNAFIRYSHDGNNGYSPHASGELPSDWDVNRNWADSGVFSLISVLNPSTANEFRYSMTYWSNANNPPTAAQCPAPCLGLGMPNITIYGVSNFAIGNSPDAPQTRVLRRQSFADNVTRQYGRHAIKFGGAFEYERGVGTYAYFSPASMVLFSPEIVTAVNQALTTAGYGAYQLRVPSSLNTLQQILQLPVAGFAMGVGDINQPPLWHRGDADHGGGIHFYAQDNWRVRPRLSINYGLAWTYLTNDLNFDLTKPQYLAPLVGQNGIGHEQHAPHDFSPMLGFAWTATKDNKTVVRGGAGIYYDTINTEVRLIERAMLGPSGTGRALLRDSVFFSSIAQINGFALLPPAIQPTSLATNPLGQQLGFPGVTNFSGNELLRLLPTFYSGAVAVLGSPDNTSLAVRNINVFKTGTELLAPNFRPPYSEHASLGIQREVRTDFVVSADFVFRQYLDQMIRDTDLNHFYSASGPVIPVCKGSQAFVPLAQCSTGVIQAIVSGARSHYAGLLVRADKRFSHRTSGTLSYAFAHQTGYNGLVDDSNWFASWGPQGPRHTLTGSLAVDLPEGFQISGITSFVSTPPVEPVVAGVDLNGNGAVEAGESPGSPLPGAGFNQFGVNLGKSDLIRLVNRFNQNYAGKYQLALPQTFSFPRPFQSQDMRVTKFFHLRSERRKLSLFGECFNVFNIANLSGYTYNLTNSGVGFGVPTQRASNIFGSGGPRAFQVGGRLSF